jgi:excisionase family DNA binding protein
LLPTPGVPDQLLSVRDVARVLGVSAATIYRLVSDGHLPHVRVLNAIRVRPDVVREFVSRDVLVEPPQ